jgi:hypothetical protein
MARKFSICIQIKNCKLFLLSFYDSNESIDFVHGKIKKKFIEVLDE